MGPNTGYLFETLGTPHASFVLPGEDVAAALYERVSAAADRVREGDREGARGVGRVDPSVARVTLDGVPGPLRAAIRELRSVWAALEHLEPGDRGDGAASWCDRARGAMDRVVRKSVEMRVIAIALPRGIGRLR